MIKWLWFNTNYNYSMNKLNLKVKEQIAKIIGDNFTTNEIVNVFTDANVKTDVSLYAKWKIILNGFSNISSEEVLFYIIEQFCHPLNFSDAESRSNFISKLNEILKYEFLDLVATERTVKIVDLNDETMQERIRKPAKTSTDYIVDALNFFKNEYNKVRISGLYYEYLLGENASSEQLELDDEEEYNAKLESIKRLNNVGLITEYKIEERMESGGYYVWDYAICKIDEQKLTGKEEPLATDADIKSITKKIIHEHTHRFENSIQEKGIDLNIKNIEDNVVIKNKKKITLPRFPRTEWSKVLITLLDDTNILLSDGKSTKPSSFEGIGCEDGRNGKPDENWAFLVRLAKGNGQTIPISKKERESKKKQKQKITDILRKIFQNETDPFENESGGVYNAKFNIKYNTDKKEKTDSIYSDLEDVFSEMTAPNEEDMNSDFSQ